MDFSILLKGFLIGFAIAAPVGPIGLLTIRRTLALGLPSGLLTGLGAASADAVFGAIAAFGITAISSVLLGAQFWLGVLGGLFLLWLGWQTFTAKSNPTQLELRNVGLLGMFASTFGLVLTNPISILYFVGIIASVGAAGNPASASLMVFGVFLGSSLWWTTLVVLTGSLRSRINAAALGPINRVSGVAIAGFGVWALWQAFTRA